MPISLMMRLAKESLLLRTLRGLFNASTKVTREEFANFSRHILNHFSGIQALEWIPKITLEKKQEYILNAREDGFPHFEITEQDDKGQIITALSRPEYFPVYYVEPLDGNERAFGYDLSSNPVRNAALRESALSGMDIAHRAHRACAG